jgi:hypothetical protein
MPCAIPTTHSRQPIVLTFGPVGFDCYVTTIDVAGFGETLAQGGHNLNTRHRRTCTEISDDWDNRLLRVCRERPRNRRAAQTADEISTSEQTAQHVFSTLPVNIIKHCITKARARPWIILKCSESFGSTKALRSERANVFRFAAGTAATTPHTMRRCARCAWPIDPIPRPRSLQKRSSSWHNEVSAIRSGCASARFDLCRNRSPTQSLAVIAARDRHRSHRATHSETLSCHDRSAHAARISHRV